MLQRVKSSFTNKCHSSLKMGNIPGIIILKCGKLSHVNGNDVIEDGGGDKKVKHNVENVQVSIDLMQDPCCHVTDIPQNNCVIFKELRYDFDNDNV